MSAEHPKNLTIDTSNNEYSDDISMKCHQARLKSIAMHSSRIPSQSVGLTLNLVEHEMRCLSLLSISSRQQILITASAANFAIAEVQMVFTIQSFRPANVRTFRFQFISKTPSSPRCSHLVSKGTRVFI